MKSKTGCAILVIGRQGVGKSPTIKALAEKSGMKNRVVFDRRKEYDPAGWTVFYSLNSFTKKLPSLTDSFIVVEEATGFVSNFKDQELTDILIGIEHNRDILIFVFHSLLDCPLYIQRFSRFMYLFPTNDIAESVETSRPHLFKFFSQVGQKTQSGFNKPVLIDLNET